MPVQVLKRDAGYRSANYSQTEFCRVCRSVNTETNRCSRVSGRVDFGGVCDLFYRDPKKHSLPPRNPPLHQGAS